MPTLPPASFDTASPYAEAMSLPQILFSFRGRIPRKTYWLYGVLGLLLVSVMATLLFGIAGVEERRAEALGNLLIVWPAAAISAKRWHDRNQSAWWLLINLVPVVGVIWSLVVNGFLRGTVGANRYGEDLTGRL
jgi:uncharacterized membrane protein YhaH (DUF805 family)